MNFLFESLASCDPSNLVAARLGKSEITIGFGGDPF